MSGDSSKIDDAANLNGFHVKLLCGHLTKKQKHEYG